MPEPRELHGSRHQPNTARPARRARLFACSAGASQPNWRRGNWSTFWTSSWICSAAAPVWRQALDAVIEAGDVEGVALVLRTAAGAAERSGESDIAERLWRTIPARRGESVLAPLFSKEEAQLRGRLGAMIPMGIAASVRGAQTVLTQPDAQTTPPSSAEPAVQAAPPEAPGKPVKTGRLVFGDLSSIWQRTNCASWANGFTSNRRCSTCCATWPVTPAA